jgi:hypothetical protein
MKAKLPLMIQDPVATVSKGMTDLVEQYEFEERFFLDGPITERVAVLDFDEHSGQLLPGARFIPPQGAGWGKYDVHPPTLNSEIDREFIQVSVLATILKTMEFAERDRVLGRKLRWAFDAPQLLVIPQAGDWPNAYYERDTHSLQFFFFDDKNSRRIYTSLSRDIVAHETAHAILDGISPDLYDALSPQSLALHEAFADLTAVIMAMHSPKLASTVLEQTNGSLRQNSNAFSRIAEQFGREQRGSHSLRDLHKEIRLDQVPSYTPHELSLVLSSALYRALLDIVEKRRERLIAEEGANFANPEYSLSGKALAVGVQQFARMIFRALDYLPPGEISFADYGRAILAADKVAFPSDEAYREFFREAFLRRRIVTDGNSLDSDTDFGVHLPQPVDLDDLVESDWVAYQFANQPEIRKLLAIPDHVSSFRVHPRLKTVKRFTENSQTIHDIIFKVSWDHIEANNVGNGLPNKRRITAGTTLIINAEQSRDVEMPPEDAVLEVMQMPTKGRVLPSPYEKGSRMPLRIIGSGKDILHVRARLTSDLGQQQQRDAMLTHLIQEGLVEIDERAFEFDNRQRATAVYAHIQNQVLKMKATCRMLHVV